MVSQSHTTGTGVTVNTDPEIVVQVTIVWSPHRDAHCTRTNAHRRMHIKIEIQTEADTRTNTHMRTSPPHTHTYGHNTHTHFNCVAFRLALYVYEYLLHVGAQKAAQTFLNEVLRKKSTFYVAMH